MENSNLIDDEINISDIFSTLLRNKKLITFSVFFLTLGSIIYTYITKPIWSGSFQIVVEKKQESNTNFLGNLDLSNPTSLLKGKKDNKTQEFILNSPSVLMSVFDYVKEEELKKGNDYGDLTYNKWKKDNWEIKFAKDTDVLLIKYRNPDKELILCT